MPLEFCLLGEDSVAPGIQWTVLYFYFFFWSKWVLKVFALAVSLNAILNPAALFVQHWAAFLPFFAWALLLKGLLIPATLQRCLWELMWPVSWPLTDTQNQELCWNSGSSKTRKTVLISSQYSSRAPQILCACSSLYSRLSLAVLGMVHNCAQTCQWHDLCVLGCSAKQETWL